MHANRWRRCIDSAGPSDRSTNSGGSRQRLSLTGFGDAASSVIDHKDSLRRMASAGGAYLKGVDGGAHWQTIAAPPHSTRLVWDPADPVGVYNLSSDRSVQKFPAPAWLSEAGNPDALPKQFDGLAFINLTGQAGSGTEEREWVRGRAGARARASTGVLNPKTGNFPLATAKLPSALFLIPDSFPNG